MTEHRHLAKTGLMLDCLPFLRCNTNIAIAAEATQINPNDGYTTAGR